MIALEALYSVTVLSLSCAFPKSRIGGRIILSGSDTGQNHQNRDHQKAEARCWSGLREIGIRRLVQLPAMSISGRAVSMHSARGMSPQSTFSSRSSPIRR